MRATRRYLATTIALGAHGLAACASPHSKAPVSPSGRWTNEPQDYVVLNAATPSPFTQPGCKVIVEPIDHTALMVGRKSVRKYEAEKDETFAAGFDQDLDDASTTFANAVKQLGADFFEPGVPSNTFVLRPKMKSWEPGFDSGNWARRDAQMKIVVDVVDPTGALVEQIAVEGTLAVARDAPLVDMRYVVTEGASRRMRELAGRLGASVSRYLADRFTCR